MFFTLRRLTKCSICWKGRCSPKRARLSRQSASFTRQRPWKWRTCWICQGQRRGQAGWLELASVNNQKSNLKMQNEKEKFKENFVKRLISFTVQIIRFCRKLKSDSSLWSIIDQLIRSAGSIGANVVEAKSSSSKRDYLHFFEIALKSANETKYWLLVLIEVVTQHKQEAEKISKILGASVLTLKGKKEAYAI